MFGPATASFGPKTLARATAVRDLVQRAFDEVRRHDDEKGVDADPRKDHVSIASATGGRTGLTFQGIDIPAWHVVEEIRTATAAYDAGGKVIEGRIENDFHPAEALYAGAGGVDTMRAYPTRFHGRAATALEYHRDECRTTFGEYHREKVVVAADTGEILSYKGKDLHQPFGAAVKEMVTTPAGVFLTITAGLLFGMPMTLGGALFGPAAGVVAAGVTIVGFAAAKARPWNRELPTHNE